MAANFLRTRWATQGRSKKLDSDSRKYIPLFGCWLIDISLLLGWHQPLTQRHWPEIFTDGSFCALTDMTIIDDDSSDESHQRITLSTCRKLLVKQREHLQDMKLSARLPLFKNISLLADLLELTEADQAVLTFALGLGIFAEFRDAISNCGQSVNTPLFCNLLAKMTGIKKSEILRSLGIDSVLSVTGLIDISRKSCDLEEKVTVVNGLQDIMMTPSKSVDQLIAQFMRRVAPAELSLEQFPHIKKDKDILTEYLKNATSTNTIGVNILVHGKPGVGKNQFIQALAQNIQVELYEVAFTDQEGYPIKGEERLRAYALCQRLLARNKNSMLLFDEIEDVFGSGDNMFSMLFGSENGQSNSTPTGKAWINRTMENNPVPAIWVSNQVTQIDKAYLRRFDYSVSFPTPPHSIRIEMARYHFKRFRPPEVWLERLTTNEEITPAQFERAAKVARIGSHKDKKQALELAELVLERSTTLLKQNRVPKRLRSYTAYNLEWLNTDLPISRLVEGIKRRPRGSFCFYGASGTGKSELARHIADEAGKPLLIKKTSDILSKWVGEAEQNIAAMFTLAREQDAVLLLDEADSFLSDRRDAQHGWEVTQVNELLTQMESFEGIFICTTNLMDRLDQASLRRFAFKVHFGPLKSEHRVAMFNQELLRLGGKQIYSPELEIKIKSLELLTPGDFAVAARQFELGGDAVTADLLYDVLLKECKAKGVIVRKIGFGA